MHEVAIIGAGPIGLEVACALKREGVDYAHLDAGQIGSTLLWWAPGTRFFSSPERIAVAGVPLVTVSGDKATREEYLAYLRAVAEQFDLQVRTFERVEAITARKDGFALRTTGAGGAGEVTARRVVVAIGDMHRPRMLNVPGEDLPFVSHYLREPHVYFRRRVLIVGGRNSAVEAAIRLWRAGARVSMSYRREEFDGERIKYWLLPEIRHLIKSGEIPFHGGTVPLEIEPGRVVLGRAGGDGGREGVETDDVLLLTGYEMDGSLLEGAGVELVGDQRAPKFTRATMETNVPGLHVAGTATAGTQSRFRVFIENCHAHAARIVSSVTGRAHEEPAPVTGAPET